jgi:hypothetical protein
MTRRNRETLRNFFGDGALPTKDHFGDLVDSMLNMSDEGFRKSAQNGLEISTPGGHDALLSFYRDQSPQAALWSLRYGGERERLCFHSSPHDGDALPPVLALDATAKVGINTATPRSTLDVGGVISSQGRHGSYPVVSEDALLADGEWHDLTDTLQGCQAFEVMAGTGHAGTGRYALLYAVALNTFNPTGLLEFWSARKRIRCDHAYYSRRCDKLQLRWHGTSGKGAAYRLQIRSGCDYGSQVRIRCFLTRLWFDEAMRGAVPSPT